MSGAALGLAAGALALAGAGLWFAGLSRVRLEGRRVPFLVAMGLAFLLGAAAFLLRPGLWGGIGAGLGVAIGGLFSALGAFSGQERRVPAVRVGAPVIEFSAPDANDRPFDTASLRGRPYLLKFFRGHW